MLLQQTLQVDVDSLRRVELQRGGQQGDEVAARVQHRRQLALQQEGGGAGARRVLVAGRADRAGRELRDHVQQAVVDALDERLLRRQDVDGDRVLDGRLRHEVERDEAVHARDHVRLAASRAAHHAKRRATGTLRAHGARDVREAQRLQCNT